MLGGASHATIENCVLENNTDGMLLYPESGNNDNKIINNDIQYNTETGIEFEHCCHESNLVQGNNISYNGHYGMRMLTSWGNEISYNQFYYNDIHAICILQCMCGGQDNEIHHNDFIKNHAGSVQAYDYLENGQNYWYSQTDHEGNFWSDFENNPGYPYYYEIDGSGSMDLYPFLEPVGDCPFFALAQGPSAPEAVYIPIQFTGKAYGGRLPYTWYWVFGDGHDSIEQNPIHSYDQTGIYTVVLTVTDSLGYTADDTISVTIVNIHNIDKDTYYGTIQAASDDADPYNTICVSAGIYYEHEITIDKALNLIGEDRNTTIIDGEGIGGNVIQTEVNSVTVSGFTIKNCYNYTNKAGIKINAHHTTISDNILISNDRHGIAFRDGSCYNTISGNEIISNSYCGIKLYNDCRHNAIFDNNIHGNGQYGLYFYDSSDSNGVYHNNFANSSSNNARDECDNIWDDGYPSGGNHWGNYTSSDTLSGPDQNQPGADGIGDTLYSIPGGGNVDRYPLMDIVDIGPPEAIDDLIILLESGTKSTDGDMRLIWTEPEDDVGVTRYVIYRSTVAGSTGDSLAETTDTTYLDVGAAGDELTNFFYTVRAADAVGNKSGESNKVGEFDRGPINGE
jgi:parallel beta-helix repeat protein